MWQENLFYGEKEAHEVTVNIVPGSQVFQILKQFERSFIFYK